MKGRLKVGIDGLGLIGGSVARSLRRVKIIESICARDANADSIALALEKGVIDIGQAAEDGKFEIFETCDVVFVCTPVDSVVNNVVSISECSSALITDVGSFKNDIVNKVREKGVVRFIGGHPMAGSERVGFAASDAMILENAVYILTPYADSCEADVLLLEELISCMGGLPVITSPELHDLVVSAVSHLPHITAAALCDAVADYNEPLMKILAAGGFRDITRIASANPDLWTEIVSGSSYVLAPVLRRFIDKLAEVCGYLENGRADKIYDFFERGMIFRNSINIGGKGILKGLPEISINVKDRPGEIGRIASLLGEKGINIQNINIRNSREYEGGLMKITLQDEHDADIAQKLLNSAHMIKTGLMGFPLSHSMSKEIHERMFEKSGLSGEYIMLDFPPEDLCRQMEWAKKYLNGFNCTIPYKEKIIPLLDETDKTAKVYKAVNTVVVKDGRTAGYNTDGFGFRYALKQKGITVKGKKVLVAGSGGVARVLAFESFFEGAEQIIIFARNVNKALILANEINDEAGFEIAHVSAKAEKCDVILNGTPVGMWPNIGEMPQVEDVLPECEAVYDTIYNPVCTKLLRTAAAMGKVTANGLSMLVLQAAAAREIWGFDALYNDENIIDDIISDTEAGIKKTFAPNLLLMGFPGCGKTTVGRILSERMAGYEFEDTDDKVEILSGKTISEIFESEGEKHFRKLEREVLSTCVSGRNKVISAGGGAVISEENRAIINRSPCIKVFIDVPPEIISGRLENTSNRPLLASGDDFHERMTALFNERIRIYKRTADIIIRYVEGDTPEAIAERIAESVR